MIRFSICTGVIGNRCSATFVKGATEKQLFSSQASGIFHHWFRNPLAFFRRSKSVAPVLQIWMFGWHLFSSASGIFFFVYGRRKSSAELAARQRPPAPVL